jgi:hypothetical protein
MAAIKKILDRVYVGDDDGVPEAKRRGYTRICCCKDGPDGHRALLGYTTLGAPQNSEYLWAQRGHVGAMNLIDNGDETMIADEMIFTALRFAIREYRMGRTLFFHCNHGFERGPTMALMFLRAIGEISPTLIGAKRVFGQLYPDFTNKREGLVLKLKKLWTVLPTLAE